MASVMPDLRGTDLLTWALSSLRPQRRKGWERITSLWNRRGWSHALRGFRRNKGRNPAVARMTVKAHVATW